MKTGDAKLWVYHPDERRDHDCQAAEDHNQQFVVVLPGSSVPGFFYRVAKSNHANPDETGDAKKKE